MERFLRYLAQFPELTTDDLALIARTGKLVTVRKGEYLVRPGETCRRLAFISAGVVRVCTWREEAEVTKYFLREEQFAICPDSFSSQTPTSEGLQAVTDCELVVYGYEQSQQFFELIPNWSKVVLRVTEQTLMQIIHHRSGLITEDAPTRYRQFMSQQADIAWRVPLGQIASYLGIRQPTLSKLRRAEMVHS